jgi:hypothetical protein
MIDRVERRMPGTVHRHKLIVETAREMAQSLYEEVMHDNAIYDKWKELCPELTREFARERFVELMLPRLCDAARDTLAGMLAIPAHAHLHESIYHALLGDSSLARGNRALRRRARSIARADGQ